ncbi:hypothetical protein [Flavobacterium rhizosphaerae]|uniref:Uncharacterized protein n=1 Tax=Flavobacterium rhizosphaerae TaxID=3163298 RepID=A0ABW8Z0K1_9FLAO
MVGWKEGLQKVSLTKLQHEMLGMSLREAKQNVDLLLEGKEIVVEIDNNDLAVKFMKEAEAIGVIFQ